ncbi:SoxR reducing system RseC family protein [Elongatibacter sediminis]|uniref:SoxR reducing system RseC family protein n=1 Tax=Elongatibacter sediminis TaxID=3119006 RepID=A0AAW9RA18_9GAMM
MIEQQGCVIGVDGGTARIRVGPASGCPACDSGQGCGAGVFGRLLRRRPVELRLENGAGVEAGDAVFVGLPERLFLSLVARLYLLPLLAGLAGAALGHYLGTVADFSGARLDLAALAGGVTGVAVALGLTGRSNPARLRGAVTLLRRVEQHSGGACQPGEPRPGRY